MDPIAKLEHLIKRGAFASRLDNYLDQILRGPGTKYAAMKKAEGYDAAERELAERVKAQHLDLYSAAIEPVACSILALAKAQADCLVDISDYQERARLSRIGQIGWRDKFLIKNPLYHRLSGQFEDEGMWARYTDRGLQAVILTSGYDEKRSLSLAEMTLVFPRWSTQASESGEFSLVMFETTGVSTGFAILPYTWEDGKPRPFNDIDKGLQELLGMGVPDESMGFQSAQWGITRALGFPGAEDYLVARLPDLSTYFSTAADALSTPH